MPNTLLLEMWSHCDYDKVLYDSEVDGKDGAVFRNKILRHDHLYFIVIDSNCNVFGHYHPSSLKEGSNYDDKVFMFSLRNCEGEGPRKFKPKTNGICTTIYRGNRENYQFYSSGYIVNKIDGYCVNTLNPADGVMTNISNVYANVRCSDFLVIKQFKKIRFMPQRLVVIQMQERRAKSDVDQINPIIID